MEILPGNEKRFLAPLSIRKIPMVGEKTYQILSGMGVELIRTVQEMPLEKMEQLLGQNGKVIWNKANGIDDNEIIPYSERKSISKEQTFEKDTIDTNNIKAILVSMAEDLAYQLRCEKKLTSCVTVKIRYSDFSTYTLQMKLPYTSLDHVLMQKVKELFDKLYQNRMLIRLIGVRFSHLVEGNYQYKLFEDNAAQLELHAALDNIRQRFGKDAVFRAIGMGKKRDDFNPFKG